ncbi:hypothetical protein ACI8AF_03220 [Blastococcus sp. SYSU D00669]
MRTSLSPVRRCARVVAAVALISLTAACGPEDLGLDAAGAGPSASADAGAPGDAGVPSPAGAGTPHDDGLPAVPAPEAGEPVEEPATASPEPATEVPPPPAAESPEESVPEAPEEVQPESAPPASPSGTRPAAAAGTPSGTGTPSGGSGGAFTDRPRSTFTAANGQSGRYLLYAGGIDPSRPVGLVVYADGTGEYGVDNPTSPYALGGPSGLVAAAKARNAITLAVESPDQACECWHTGDTSAYADFLADLIETQLENYPVDELWLTGFSSGAQEVTRFLVPRHPELLRVGGGWVVFGGGGPPADGGAGVTAARMAGVRGHWYTGTADTAVPLTAAWGAQAGERWYAGRGVVTSHEWPVGVGHALDGRLGSTVGRLLDAS